jgi:hypothetical protein
MIQQLLFIDAFHVAIRSVDFCVGSFQKCMPVENCRVLVFFFTTATYPRIIDDKSAAKVTINLTFDHAVLGAERKLSTCLI